MYSTFIFLRYSSNFITKLSGNLIKIQENQTRKGSDQYPGTQKERDLLSIQEPQKKGSDQDSGNQERKESNYGSENHTRKGSDLGFRRTKLNMNQIRIQENQTRILERNLIRIQENQTRKDLIRSGFRKTQLERNYSNTDSGKLDQKGIILIRILTKDSGKSNQKRIILIRIPEN